MSAATALAFAGFVRTVTTSRETRVRESDDRLRALVDRAPFGIFSFTPEGRFLDANPAMLTILGYQSVEELLRVDMRSSIYRDPADHSRLIDACRAQAAGVGAAGLVLRLRTRNGLPVLVRIVCRHIHDSEGRTDILYGIAEDVTESHRRDELKRRAERLEGLQTLLGGAAHELNNPLATIAGFAQILLQDATEESERSALTMIHEEANRAARIVRDLVVFARQHPPAATGSVDVNEVIAYVLATSQAAFAGHGAEHEVSLAPELPPVACDRDQLEQAILNLVTNASEACAAWRDSPAADSRKPCVTIRTRERSGCVLLEIEDNGPGIDPRNRHRIWDPFFTTKSDGSGTGLGLAVVHGIITDCGGTVEVDSEVGRGTRMVVSLPAA